VTPGRARGLAQLAGARGAVALGLLHEVEPQDRLLVCRAVAPHLTGVVLDHETAARAAVDGSLPGRCGLAVDLAEAAPPGLPTRLAAGCSPATARRLGASAAFLRIQLRTDLDASAERELRVAGLAARLCQAEELPLVLQLRVPRVPGDGAGFFDDAREPLTREAVTRIARIEADLLVLPACAPPPGSGPWVCLLEGEGPDAQQDELEHACGRGARGFAASLAPPGAGRRGPRSRLTGSHDHGTGQRPRRVVRSADPPRGRSLPPHGGRDSGG
jgi:tagatose-1,6-bisphosphate aldolase